MKEKKERTLSLRSMYTFGLGTIGRDMCYMIVNSFFINFLTDGVGLETALLTAINVIMVICRVWDAINDPMMGTIIDNDIFHSRRGKFKPWILIGALSNIVVVILMFVNYKASGNLQVVIYGLLYLLWGMTYTMNDISYWSMLPSLTIDPEERSKVGTVTNIGASIGQFAIVAGASPIANALAASISQKGAITSRGDAYARAFLIIAVAVAALFLICTLMTFFGVEDNVKKDKVIAVEKKEKTTLKGMLKIIKENDQLLIVSIAYVLYNIGYGITTTLGLYYFNYVFSDYGVGTKYMLFAIILAVSTIGTMACYPLLSRKFTRKKLYSIGMIVVIIGYIGIFSVGTFLPLNMVIVSIFGAFTFFGTSTLSMLIIMMYADTVEYGQWKTGTRNESIVYSIRPFSVKLASALSGFIATQTLILTGLNDVSKTLGALDQSNKETFANKVEEIISSIPAGSITWLKIMMTLIPLVIMVISWIIFMKKFDLDKDRYNQIVKELEAK